jgi:hypothetical protein
MRAARVWRIGESYWRYKERAKRVGRLGRG